MSPRVCSGIGREIHESTRRAARSDSIETPTSPPPARADLAWRASGQITANAAAAVITAKVSHRVIERSTESNDRGRLRLF